MSAARGGGRASFDIGEPRGELGHLALQSIDRGGESIQGGGGRGGWVGGGSVGVGGGSGGAMLTVGAATAVVVALVPDIGDVSDTRLSEFKHLRA